MINEIQKDTFRAWQILAREIDPDAWVSVDELDAVKRTLRFFYRAIDHNAGMIALVWHEFGEPRSIAARLN